MSYGSPALGDVTWGDAEEVEGFLPLPASVIRTIVALADGKKHGYAIMRDVADLSGGAVRMRSGTLYGSIKRMLDQGLIDAVIQAVPFVQDRRPRSCDAPGHELVTEPRAAVDLTTTPVHLGLRSRALPVEGFEWVPRAGGLRRRGR